MPIDVDAAASDFWTARARGEHFPSAYFGRLSLDDAYRIQLALIERRVACGERQIGWKVGLTAKPIQEQFGFHEPVFGCILESRSVVTTSVIGASFSLSSALFGPWFGTYVDRQRGIPVLVQLTLAAPALPLAQAIGRWGNWPNQELYGEPTDLPWALEIDAEHNGDYADGTTFHPTFLYESLWNFALCGVLLAIDRRWGNRLAPGKLFALYLVGYGVGRLWVETLRIDPANEIGGLRVNQWMSLALIAGGAVWMLAVRNRPWPQPPGGAASSADEAGDPAELDAPPGVDDVHETYADRGVVGPPADSVERVDEG